MVTGCAQASRRDNSTVPRLTMATVYTTSTTLAVVQEKELPAAWGDIIEAPRFDGRYLLM